jgi:hypothetical protein
MEARKPLRIERPSIDMRGVVGHFKVRSMERGNYHLNNEKRAVSAGADGLSELVQLAECAARFEGGQCSGALLF